MQLANDPGRVRKKVQRIGTSAPKGIPVAGPFSLEVVQLLDVFARIEVRRQARLRTPEKEAG